MADQILQRLAQASSVEQFEMFSEKQVRGGRGEACVGGARKRYRELSEVSPEGNTRFQEAEKWLFIERSSPAFFSFESICEILRLQQRS